MPNPGATPDVERRGAPSGHRTPRAILVVAGGLVAVLLITGLFFAHFLALERAERLVENETIARGVAASILARQEGYTNLLLAYASRFRFREAVKRRDRDEVFVHLRQLHDAFPELDRPVLADPFGLAWATYPESPEITGRSFAHRDWYHGVSRDWQPYMSEVFQTTTPDRSLAVALAVPIRDEDRTVIGILVAVQRLEVIRQWLLPVRVPGGDLYVVDRKGQFVFHPIRTGSDQLADYAQVPAVERLLRGEAGVGEMENPVEQEVRLVAYQPLQSLGWGVVVQRSKDSTFQRVRTLVYAAGGAGLVLAAALVAMGVVALRTHQQTTAALAALEQKTRALRDSEMKFRSVTQSAHDAVISADSGGNVLSWNHGAETIFGYRDEEVLGKPLTVLMPERYRDAYRAGLERLRVTGESPVVGKTIELCGLRKDGSEFPLELSLATWTAAGQHFYSGIIRDITERRRADAALREAQEELVRKERLAFLGQLAGGVGHELRNPLGVIKNSTYYLRMILPEDERVGKHLGILEREVATANRIVTDLLDFARSKPPTRVPTDLSALVSDALERTRLPDNITVVLDLAEHLPPVATDPEQVGQVLDNLISNAAQAMPEGGTLTIVTVPANGGALSAVSDTGAGISPDHLEKIFQPLFTTKAKGIGLGLAVAKNLTEANGGTISVESVPGRGSRFAVWFDRAVEEG